MNEEKIITTIIDDLTIESEPDGELMTKQKKKKVFYKAHKLPQETVDSQLLLDIESIESDIKKKTKEITVLKLKHEIRRIAKTHKTSNEDIPTFIFRRVSSENRTLFNELIMTYIQSLMQ